MARDWDGPLQYEDAETHRLMMLPTDLALRDDPAFRVYVDEFAADEQAFFDAFAESFSTLLSLGCPAHVQPGAGDDNEAGNEVCLFFFFFFFFVFGFFFFLARWAPTPPPPPPPCF